MLMLMLTTWWLGAGHGLRFAASHLRSQFRQCVYLLLQMVLHLEHALQLPLWCFCACVRVRLCPAVLPMLGYSVKSQ